MTRKLKPTNQVSRVVLNEQSYFYFNKPYSKLTIKQKIWLQNSLKL